MSASMERKICGFETILVDAADPGQCSLRCRFLLDARSCLRCTINRFDPIVLEGRNRTEECKTMEKAVDTFVAGRYYERAIDVLAEASDRRKNGIVDEQE